MQTGGGERRRTRLSIRAAAVWVCWYRGDIPRAPAGGLPNERAFTRLGAALMVWWRGSVARPLQKLYQTCATVDKRLGMMLMCRWR